MNGGDAAGLKKCNFIRKKMHMKDVLEMLQFSEESVKRADICEI